MHLQPLVVAIALESLGKIMIAFTALMVHHRVLKEHDIDARVFREMRLEQAIGVVGVLLMLIGDGAQMYLASVS